MANGDCIGIFGMRTLLRSRVTTPVPLFRVALGSFLPEALQRGMAQRVLAAKELHAAASSSAQIALPRRIDSLILVGGVQSFCRSI